MDFLCDNQKADSNINNLEKLTHFIMYTIKKTQAIHLNLPPAFMSVMLEKVFMSLGMEYIPVQFEVILSDVIAIWNRSSHSTYLESEIVKAINLLGCILLKCNPDISLAIPTDLHVEAVLTDKDDRENDEILLYKLYKVEKAIISIDASQKVSKEDIELKYQIWNRKLNMEEELSKLYDK